MGPSRWGKSTLLNVLGCLERPASREVSIGRVHVMHKDSRKPAATPPATKSGLPFKTTNCSLPGTLMQRHAASDVHERKRQPHCRAGHHTVGIGGQKKNVSQAGGIKRPDHHHCRPWCGERRGDGHPHHGRGVIDIALVALVVGRIVIVMLISVMKQTREIGLVKVTAATNGEILNLLLP